MWQALIPVASALIGNVAGGNSTEAANNNRSAATNAINSIKVPTIEEQLLALEDYVNAGILSPEMIEQMNEQPQSPTLPIQGDSNSHFRVLNLYACLGGNVGLCGCSFICSHI